MAIGAAGLAAAAAAPLLELVGPTGAASAAGAKGAATAARVVSNPNLLWNGSFEIGTMSSASTTTAVWANTSTF